MADEPNSPPEVPKKKGRIEIRVEPELEDLARAKAARHGWSLSAVLRGLLVLWAKDDENVIDPSEVGAASERAPYKRTSLKNKKRKGGTK